MKKMIYLGKYMKCENLIYPKKNSIVEVYQSPYYHDHYTVLGYETAKDGRTQSFAKEGFAEPQTNKLSSQLASAVIWREMIEHPALQEIEINPKVFNTNAKF